MNVAALTAVRKFDDVRYVGPINPPVHGLEKFWSKARRIAGAKGDFFFFSDRRLRSIAERVAAESYAGATMDFFHGFTPWIQTRPQRPYMAWSDCTFRDYIEIYHPPGLFRQVDIDRIADLECAWLRKAGCIAFTTAWAAERAQRDYGLDKGRVAVLGIFGEIERPAADAYAGAQQFCFVSTNFEAKGGAIALEAFGLVKARHPKASLVIVGDKPKQVFDESVTYAGFLRKEDSGEYQRFKDILSQSRAVIHPTRSDIGPLLLVEAAYFGCPAISSRRFAIPELVDDKKTGILLEDPIRPDALAQAMCWILENEDAYRDMRKAAMIKGQGEHSKERFGEQLIACLKAVSA